MDEKGEASQKTRVTVCIPTYNSAAFLSETLRSLLSQDYPNYEIIVVDNASTDSTPEIVRTCKDPKLAYRRFDEFVPSVKNWNRALGLANESDGKYIAICHGDDVYEPNFISEEARYLDEHPEAGGVFSSAKTIARPGTQLGKLDRPPFFKSDEITAKELLIYSLNTAFFPLVSPTFMARKETLAKTGYFDITSKFAFDMDYYFRLFDWGSVGYLAKHLINYRVHPMQASVRFYDTTDTQAEFYQIVDREMKKLGLELTDAQKCRLEANRHWGWAIDAVSHAKLGDPKKALELTKKALVYPDALIDFPVPKFIFRVVLLSVFLSSQYVGLGKLFADIVYLYKAKKRGG